MAQNKPPKGGSPLNVGQPAPVVLPSQGAKNPVASPAAATNQTAPAKDYQIDYDLIVKPDLDAMPADGQMFLENTVRNQSIAYKTKDLDGKIVRGSLDLTNLQVVSSKIVNNKLAQDAINIDKQIIINAIRASTTAKLFKDAKALLDAQKADEQAELAKELKKRNDEVNKLIQNPRPAGGESNAAEMQRLSNMSMEGLAIKMILDEVIFILQMVLCSQYFMDSYNYNKLSDDLVYDLNENGPKGPRNKPLYSFDFVGDKIVLDKTKPIEVERVAGKARLKIDNKPEGYSDAMIIMANGYLPPPTVLSSLQAEFANYVHKQMEVVLDPQKRQIEANYYKEIEEKKSNEPGTNQEKMREIQMAQNLAARPAPPRPTGK